MTEMFKTEIGLQQEDYTQLGSDKKNYEHGVQVY
jgi:hypothetical protein